MPILTRFPISVGIAKFVGQSQAMRVAAGQDTAFDLMGRNPDGSAMVFTGGKLILGVREWSPSSPTDGALVFPYREAVITGVYTAEWDITYADTEGQKPRLCVADGWFTDTNGGKSQCLRPSPFKIDEAITDPAQPTTSAIFGPPPATTGRQVLVFNNVASVTQAFVPFPGSPTLDFSASEPNILSGDPPQAIWVDPSSGNGTITVNSSAPWTGYVVVDILLVSP